MELKEIIIFKEGVSIFMFLTMNQIDLLILMNPNIELYLLQKGL